jgi:hypothetical protein
MNHLQRTTQQPNIKTPNLQRKTSLEEFRSEPLHLRTDYTELSPDFEPFFSCLVDTVRVVVKFKHKDFINNKNLLPNRRFGYGVPSRFPGISAMIMSWGAGATVMIEASAAAFPTGQNIVGIADVPRACKELIFAVLEAGGLRPTAEELAAIEAGDFRITRADLVVHCDCGSPDRANALMRAVHNMGVAYGKEFSAYGIESVYVGQHSYYRSFKGYRKDLLLDKHPLPQGVRYRKFLTKKSVGLVRFELVVRSPQLKYLGLDSPLAWTPTTPEELLTPWIDKLAASEALLPSTANMNQLPALLKAKLQLWLLGVESAFDDGDWTKATYLKHRRTILSVTGIDIQVPLSPELQKTAVNTIRDVLDAGVGYRDYPDKWLELVEGRK